MEESKPREFDWLTLLQIIQLSESGDSADIVSAEQKATRWVPDSACNNCFNCLSQFTTFSRKHHCRICGNIFCNDCCNESIELVTKGIKGEVKSCKFCFEAYKVLQKQMNTIINDLRDYAIGDDLDTKISAYCRKSKEEVNECYSFLKSSDMQTERTYRDDMTAAYEQLVSLLVEYILSNENEELCSKWHDILVRLTIETINMVHPSYRDLKDSMDINDYIKIKRLLYKDQSRCKVINGFALQKNVVNKKMKTSIDNPKVLLFNCALSLNRTSQVVTANFDKALSLKKPYLDIIKKKIDLLKPDLILTQKEISEEFISTYSETISLAMNVKAKSIESIARCTNTTPLPSIDLIGLKTIVGKCKRFYIEKIEREKTNELLLNNYNLMIIEGGDDCMYSTILLSDSNVAELKLIKALMKKKILPTARDLYLQKEILFISNIQPPKISLEIDSTVFENDKEGGNITYIDGFNTALINENEELLIKKMTMFRGQARLMTNNTAKNSRLSLTHKANDFNNAINFTLIEEEAEVLKTITGICEEPKDIPFKFYSENIDQSLPLGQLILNLSNSIGENCIDCNKNYEMHSYYCYNTSGRVMIAPILNQEEQQVNLVLSYLDLTVPTLHGWGKSREYCPSLTVTSQSSIFTYGYCKVCQRIATPLFKLNKEVFNYSSPKFFKDMFFNHSSRNNAFNRKEYNISNILSSLSSSSFIEPSSCNHFINKDISRIFITETCSLLFSYQDIAKYFIIPMNLNTIQGLSLTKNLHLKYSEKAFGTSNKILSLIIADIDITIGDIVNSKQALGANSPLHSLNEKLLKTSNKVKDNIESLKKECVNAFSSQAEHKNYVKAIVLIKKNYYKILQYRRICHSLERAIRQLKKLSMRIDIINKSKPNQSQSQSQEDKSPNESKDLTSEHYPIDAEAEYAEMIRFIKYYDNNHKTYACEINENDILSLIANALTSNNYLDIISTNKFQLNEVKCERKEVYLDKKIRLAQRKESRKFSVSLTTKLDSLKYGETIMKPTPDAKGINEIFFNTLLVFDNSKQTFIHPKLDSSKIILQLESELFSEEKNNFSFYTRSDAYKLKVDISEVKVMKNKKGKAYVEPLNLMRQSSSQMKDKSDRQSSIENDKKKGTLALMRSQIESIEKDLRALKDKLNKPKDPKPMKKLKPKQDSTIISSTLNLPDVEVIVYYPLKFEALRIAYCATYDEFRESISQSQKWSDVSGGKSKAIFFKSFDNKYILKGVTKAEFKMFIQSGSQYFHHQAKYLFHRMPSVLAKILGVYKIKKTTKGVKAEKYYIILMENQFYGMDDKNGMIKAYDLKGSKLNRYIQKANQKPNQVLPDTNFQEDFNGEPIALDSNLVDMLHSALHNDCLILAKMNVIDYSLLLIINDNENNKEAKFIKLGIIDYIRKYTWDKQLEHVGKRIINGLTPTIINPEEYYQRFLTEIKRYFIGI